MKFDIISLFPDYFKSPLNSSIIRRSIVSGLISFNFVNLRNFGLGKYLKVDDSPFGGGAGMVLSPGPLVAAVRSLNRGRNSRVIYLSPQGNVLNASKCRELSSYDHLVLICGHYEGVDQRAIDLEVDEEISIGDYVLTSGNAPALVLIDAVSRFIPGVVGNHEGVMTDSFENGLLEYPQYTRPECFEGVSVPDVLLKGSHKDINFWRLNASLDKTKKNRSDLYLKYLRNREQVIEDKEDGAVIKDDGFSLEMVIPVTNVFASLRFYSKVFRWVVGSQQKEIGLEKEGFISLAGGHGLRLKLDGNFSQRLVLVAAFQHADMFERTLNRWKKITSPTEVISKSGRVHTACFEDPDGHNWVLCLKQDN